MATRYKFQNKYQFKDKSEEEMKPTPMMLGLIERVLSRRRVSPKQEIVIENNVEYISVIIDGQEYMLSWDIEFYSEVVTDVSWTFSLLVSDKGGEHGQRIDAGCYKFWNKDYPTPEE